VKLKELLSIQDSKLAMKPASSILFLIPQQFHHETKALVNPSLTGADEKSMSPLSSFFSIRIRNI